MKELAKLLSDGWNITIESVVKRMKGEKGYREFISRYCWVATKPAKYDGTIKCESIWEGFKTPQQALKDLIEQMKDVK